MAYQLWKSPKIFGFKAIQGKTFVGTKNRKRCKKTILRKKSEGKTKSACALSKMSVCITNVKKQPTFARNSQVEGNAGRLLK